jgi:hypothetical protein
MLERRIALGIEAITNPSFPGGILVPTAHREYTHIVTKSNQKNQKQPESLFTKTRNLFATPSRAYSMAQCRQLDRTDLTVRSFSRI